MERKFKIGDIISDKWGNCIRQVIDVVFEQREIVGCWLNGSKSLIVKDSYVLLNQTTRCLTYSMFLFEEEHKLISSGSLLQNKVVGFANICPRCRSPLEEKMSVGLGEMIKKCAKCGWC